MHKYTQNTNRYRQIDTNIHKCTQIYTHIQRQRRWCKGPQKLQNIHISHCSGSCFQGGIGKYSPQGNMMRRPRLRNNVDAGQPHTPEEPDNLSANSHGKRPRIVICGCFPPVLAKRRRRRVTAWGVRHSERKPAPGSTNNCDLWSLRACVREWSEWIAAAWSNHNGA